MRLRKEPLKRKRRSRKPPLLRRKCPKWYGGPKSLAPSQIPLFHFRENCCPPGVPPVVRRWNKPISVPLVFHLRASKTRPGGTPASPCPVSKIGTCSTWAIKKQHTLASARHSRVVALCGLFPGGAGTYPARTAEATSERVAGASRSSFPSACAICPLGGDTAPTGRGMRKQDKGRVLTPAPATPDGRADRENGSFPRLSASACWICTKRKILSSYTLAV